MVGLHSFQSKFARRRRKGVGVCSAFAALAWPLAFVTLASAAVPLPRPRPAGAPAIQLKEAPQPPGQPADDGDAKDAPAQAQSPRPPELSACRLALTDTLAIAPSLPPIRGPGACGGEDIVRLEAVVLPDKRRVPLKPAATMRCTMATEIAAWVRNDLAPIAARLNTAVSELDNFDSFDCRGRNRVAGARLSEHGRANALDVRGIRLANGQSIALTERGTPRELRESVLQSVCARFATVLGPGSDGYHEDHIHLDLAERRGGYRICQWQVWDAWPRIAPLMPAVRPDDAPPREDRGAQPSAGAAREAEPVAQPEQDEVQPQAATPPARASSARARTKATTGAPAAPGSKPSASAKKPTQKKKGAGQPAPLQILRPTLPR